MEHLRVALLGTAHVHLADYLAVITNDAQADLVAVYEGDPAWRVTVPGAPVASTVSEALRMADVAVVGSTTAERSQLVRLVVAAGCPALVEKPLGVSMAQTAELTSLIDNAIAPVTTAMFLRCAPALRRVRSLLADDALGELTATHARFSHSGLLDGAFKGSAAWMLDPNHGAVGAFADLGIHLLDLLQWLRPDARLTVRSAWLRRRPGSPLDVDGAALLDWGDVAATIHAGWTSRPGGVHLHIEGSRGSVTVDGGRLTVRIKQERREEHDPPAAGAALTAFISALRAQESWQAPTAADIVAIARILEEISLTTS